MASTMSDQVHPSRTRSFPPEPAAVAEVRSFVAASVEGPRTLVDDACLVVSELATNVVLHARTPFSVAVEHRGEAVRLVVHDGSPRRPIASDAAPATTTGRGLQIVDALSRAWGVEPAAEGKAVWAELDRPR
ncbi:MAG: ATP-binding protein [Microthrixaceae bacterium]